jgi:hypothetical protein
LQRDQDQDGTCAADMDGGVKDARLRSGRSGIEQEDDDRKGADCRLMPATGQEHKPEK